MAYESIYIIAVIFITVLALYLYINQEYEHREEIAKIERLEKKYEMKRRRLEEIRARTEPCHIPDLNNPRECYFSSNYRCSWNDAALRCDKRVQ
jgi:hypothetical protein